jgi:hypothetical protein
MMESGKALRRRAGREEGRQTGETQGMKDQRVIAADNASATAANNGRQVELSAKNKAETSFTKISLLDICLEDNPYLRSGTAPILLIIYLISSFNLSPIW